MTRDDIIEMACQANGKIYLGGPHFSWDQAERFAALVAAAEREACAKVCEQLEPRHRMDGEWLAGWSDGTEDCAAAIRARGQKESPPVL